VSESCSSPSASSYRKSTAAEYVFGAAPVSAYFEAQGRLLARIQRRDERLVVVRGDRLVHEQLRLHVRDRLGARVTNDHVVPGGLTRRDSGRGAGDGGGSVVALVSPVTVTAGLVTARTVLVDTRFDR